jgi:hypothetical protein
VTSIVELPPGVVGMVSTVGGVIKLIACSLN